MSEGLPARRVVLGKRASSLDNRKGHRRALHEAVARLHGAIVSSLSEATAQIARIMPAKGPPTESDEGRSILRVPRLAGAPCTRCGKPVQRVVIRSRSAYFCPRCQRG